MSFRPLAVLLALLAALLAGPAAAQGLDGLRAEAQLMQRNVAALDIAVARQGAENDRLIASQGSVAQAQDVTFAALRQAQFEVDIAATRLTTLDQRLLESRERLARYNADIVRATADLSAGAENLKRVVGEAELEWRQRIRDAYADIVAKLQRYRELSASYLELRREELAVLQRVITLAAVEGVTPAQDDPLVMRLRTEVNALAQTAIALTNEAAAIAEATPDALDRRNILRLRADEALLRSNARLTDAAIVEARSVVAGLQPILAEPSIPIRLFDEALSAVDGLGASLSQHLATIATNRDALISFRRLLGARADRDAGALALRIGGLDRLLAAQDNEIRTLGATLDETRDGLLRERTERERAVLFAREGTRTDETARARIAAELAAIPQQLRTLYASRLAEVRTAVALAGREQIATFVAAGLVVLALSIYLRRRVLRRFVRSDKTRATEVPLEVVRRNLFWLYPSALWWVFVEIFAISEETAVAVLTLTAIPAAAALLRDFTQVLVSRRAVGNRRRLGVIITRATEVAVVLSSVFVFLYALLGEVPLMPSTQTAINRLIYSVFVLSGLPMLLFLFYFASAGGRTTGRLRRWIAGVLSLLPPTALIATGVTGLAGYTRLAAVMLENLAFAIAVGATVALALGILNDVIEAIATKVRQRDPARAFFVRANFLQPVLRAGQAALLVGGALLSLQVFGWTTETPGIREALAAWNATLFTVGGTAYSLGDVILSVAGFAFVFWLGAWSRRVAYTIVFGRLKDVGIRQSLSVFAQYVVIVIGVLLTLSAVGFDVTTLTVFAASLGVGIGFGLQNVTNNFISGVLLLVERPLRIGDIVTVGANSGTVQQIGIRSMRMRTFDEFDLIVPNSALISDTFTNWTRTNSMMRVVITIGIGYDADFTRAIRIVEELLDSHPGVAKSPAREVTVDDFGESAVKLRICYYIDLRGDHSGFKVRSWLLTHIRDRFEAEDISIPFLHRDIRVIADGTASEETDEALAAEPADAAAEPEVTPLPPSRAPVVAR